MIVCSTNCTLFTSFLCRFLCCQFFDKLLCFAFCSALPIKPCCHRENDAYQIGYQVFNRVLCDIHNLDRPALQCKKRLDIFEPETGKTVFMFDKSKALVHSCRLSPGFLRWRTYSRRREQTTMTVHVSICFSSPASSERPVTTHSC